MPNKILLNGQKGIGKSTLAYHFINFVLSKNENYRYNVDNFEINPENHSFKITLNRSNPNLNILDIPNDKKTINIDQVRKLISSLNKSSFNDKPRFILIDNVEFLNINSINALLKIIEEPSENIFFILINSNKNLISTLKSRCLEFKIFLSNKESIDISNQLFNLNINKLINKDLIDYYSTPGKIFNLIKFSEEFSIDLKNIKLSEFLTLIIDKGYYKKESSIKPIIYDFFELYLLNKDKFKNSKFLDFL